MERVRDRVAEMAKSNGVSEGTLHRATQEFADNVTRLAGDEPSHDITEDLIVALRVTGAIGDNEMIELLGRHIDESGV